MNAIGHVFGVLSVQRSIRDGFAVTGSCRVVMDGTEGYFDELVKEEKLQEKLRPLMQPCLKKNGTKYIPCFLKLV